MKIKDSDYDRLRAHVLPGFKCIPPLSEYARVGMTARRWCWDAWHAAHGLDRVTHTDLLRDLYAYLHDSHIETALKRISKEAPEPTRPTF